MGSLSGLGIGLSFLFGFILMGLVAEVYYLLWWKKRIANPTNTRGVSEFSFLFCFNRRVSSFNSSSSSQELTNSVSHNNQNSDNQDLELGTRNNKGYGVEEGGIELELMRAHNLCGPPRFLFTIKEESKEDLESADGRSRKGSRTKSLSEVVFALDGNGTPFLTPLSSPSTIKTTTHNLDAYNVNGLNPLYESLTEAELNRLRSSPPPKFKFLKDAEDKLIKRMLIEEAERKRRVNMSEENSSVEEESSFVKMISNGRDHNQASSQVLPLASSPTFQP